MNEFVMAAFDVFKSDKDQENLVDTLQRVIKKYKRIGSSNPGVVTSSFYVNEVESADNIF